MSPNLVPALVFTLLTLGAGLAQAQTITVNTGLDPIDIDPEFATVADLPGPDGVVSVSEAMIVSNNTPGVQTIAFAVPPAEWQWQGLFPGRAVIWTNNSFYWTAYAPVIIDGTTQTAFTGDTNPTGAEVRLFGGQLYFNTDDCVVRGMDGAQLGFNGSRHVIEDNSNVGVNLYGGSGSLVQRNGGGFVQIDQSNDNLVVGNTFDRVRVLGWFAGNQPARRNRIGGPSPSDRNVILGFGVWNSEGSPGGYAVQLFDSDSTVLENNSIGTLANGMTQAHPATTSGVDIDGRNTRAFVRDNRIAGILAWSHPTHGQSRPSGTAIGISGEVEDIEITGNSIGLDATGQPLLGGVFGIMVGPVVNAGANSVRIGGQGPGQGNTIAGHMANAILVGREMQNLRISGNSIYGNQGISVDLLSALSEPGISPNDALDADAGANALQNFPLLSSAATDGGHVQAVGMLQSEPSTGYSLEFFASPSCDSAGFGEAQQFLGSSEVTTDASGNADFTVLLTASVPQGWVVTSTATHVSTGATSEFSSCQGLTGAMTAGVGNSAAAAGVRLAPAVPNPFRASTTLRYVLPTRSPVSLSIHDVSGRLIRELNPGSQNAGAHELQWDGLDTGGRAVPAGFYLARLRAGRAVVTRNLTIIR